MTRKEAIELAKNLGNNKPYYESDIALLEALGLLKFDDPKKEVIKLCSYEDNELGMVKVELWPEGLVLWVGGEIRWKSWEVYYKVGEQVVIWNTNSDSVLGYIK